MNYLAHIFLSGADRRMQLGNFIGDAVKGSSYNDYPAAIRNGILLHRAIDSFTDRHPSVRQTVTDMRPLFGRYSGPLLDIYFDYLLASHFSEFSPTPLRRFTRKFYRTLVCNRRWLPERIRNFMWHFIGTGRLSKYAKKEGIRESLEIMAKYGRMKIDVDSAIDYLAENENALMGVFRPFFSELQAYCSGYFR